MGQQAQVQNRIRPQITKDYVRSQIVGKPDLSILEDNHELGPKFYEPEYSDLRKADVKFRETESQIKRAATVEKEILH